MNEPLATTGQEYVAALVAVFSKVEQTILNIFIVSVVVVALMVVALVLAMWFERRDRRRNAAQRAAVEARLDGGVLR